MKAKGVPIGPNGLQLIACMHIMSAQNIAMIFFVTVYETQPPLTTSWLLPFFSGRNMPMDATSPPLEPVFLHNPKMIQAASFTLFRPKRPVNLDPPILQFESRIAQRETPQSIRNTLGPLLFADFFFL